MKNTIEKVIKFSGKPIFTLKKEADLNRQPLNQEYYLLQS